MMRWSTTLSRGIGSVIVLQSIFTSALGFAGLAGSFGGAEAAPSSWHGDEACDSLDSADSNEQDKTGEGTSARLSSANERTCSQSGLALQCS